MGTRDRLERFKRGEVRGAQPRGDTLLQQIRKLTLDLGRAHRRITELEQSVDRDARLRLEIAIVIQVLQKLARAPEQLQTLDLLSGARIAGWLAGQLHAALLASQQGLDSQKQALSEKI